MKQIKVELTPREWAEKRLQLAASFQIENIDFVIEQCGFVLKEEANEKLDEPTTKEWTGYFTEKGERVNKEAFYWVNHIGYWIVEECVGDQCKFIALDGYGKKHQLNNLFKYHKP